MTHDDLAFDLARHLRASQNVMVWTNIQLGPSGSPRPDVYTIHKSYVKPTPMAYEVKVSRSDFRADATAGKWGSYLTYAQGVTFACEQGLLTKDEMPPHCGLIVRGESGWRSVKRATLNSHVVIPQAALLKLLIDGIATEGAASIYRRRCDPDESFTQKYGKEAAYWVRDSMVAQQRLKEAEATANRIIRSAEVAATARDKAIRDALPCQWDIMLSALRLSPGATPQAVEMALDRFRRQREQPSGDVQEVERAIFLLTEIARKMKAGQKGDD